MTLADLLPIVTVLAITGAGVVTGLLFAFANFVMRALADLAPDQGLLAMQRVNLHIVNPVFLVLFMGTPLLCLVLAVAALSDLAAPGAGLRLAGALAYLLGPFGITLLCNVPLNNQLAPVPPDDPDGFWVLYQQRWQWWNRLRSWIGVLAVGLLAAGAIQL